jgi:hypothetical protein
LPIDQAVGVLTHSDEDQPNKSAEIVIDLNANQHEQRPTAGGRTGIQLPLLGQLHPDNHK